MKKNHEHPLKLYKDPWDEHAKKWDEQAKKASKSHPIKNLKHLPKMVGITEKTQKYLKWKTLKYMISHDHEKKILKGFFKNPIKYLFSFLSSCIKKKSYKRDGDFFLYKTSSLKDFKKRLDEKDSLLILGFSYCHKPFECPSKRFSPECINQEDHPVCQQCFIGKALRLSPKKRFIPLIIPTIHYIGERIFDIVHRNPNKKILFIISACEMTLEMFGDWGNMTGICGTGVRLDGRICNTMRAFELSEKGVKPGLTVVLEPTKQEILNLLRHRAQTDMT